MPYRGKDKIAVNSFFTRFSKELKQELQGFANAQYRLPGIGEFISIVDDYVINLPPIPMFVPIKAILTAANMQNDPELMEKHFASLINGIITPVLPPPPPTALPTVRGDGAILADRSIASRTALITASGLTVQDAKACLNTAGMSVSMLKGDVSTGVFYHNTIHFSTSSYGVKDDRDGLYKVTCVYDKSGGDFYFIGIARHDGTESVREKRKPVDKYKVQFSLIPTFLKGDTLHFC